MENQRIRLTKTLFHQALINLLQQKNISEISVREICEKAELNRSTFYLHYQDRYELLEEIQKEMLEKEKEAVSAQTNKIVSYLEYVKENRTTYYVLIQNNGTIDFQQLSFEEITKQMADVKIINSSSPYIQYIYAYVMAGCFGIIRRWLDNECKESTIEIAGLLQQLGEDATKRYNKK